MERVLDVYKRPYSSIYPVVCMDESPKQLIEQIHQPIAMKVGRPARVDYDYIRNGVVNIFMANEPLKGKRLVEVTESKTKKDWATSDKIRNQLAEIGIQLKDEKNGNMSWSLA